MRSLKYHLQILLLLAVSSITNSGEASLGEIIDFSIDKEARVGVLKIIYKGKALREYPPFMKSMFSISNGDVQVNVSYVHSGEVFPQEFKLGTDRYMLGHL